VALSTCASNRSCRATGHGNTLGEEQVNVSKVFLTLFFCQTVNTDVSIIKACISLAVLSISC